MTQHDTPGRPSPTSDDARFDALFDSAPDAFVAVASDGRIQLFNEQAERLFGYRREEVIGQPLELLLPERNRHSHPRLRTAYFASPERRPMGIGRELAARRFDGIEFPAEISLSSIESASGPLVLAAVRDATERRRIEEANREREHAEQANLAKSEFLSRMSHELRTPLNAILGFAQLLEMDDLTSEQAESVGHILKGGRHLLDLVNEVLDIARIESGRMSLSIEPVPIDEVVGECLDLVRPAAERRSMVLPVAALPHVWAMADRQRLKQILLNLLSNAVKYGREGGCVSIACRRGGDALMIDVADEGAGIPDERMGRLFTPFDRLGAEQSGIEGVGLGLALSRRLAESMQGDITARSTVGVGSIFTLSLQPLDLEETTARLAASLLEEVAARSAPMSVGLDGQHGTILYIEDNMPNLRLVERVVSLRPGVRLISATHGQMGLELARDNQPDLVLLDINLPDMLGADVLAQLKSDPATAAIPVVVASADANGSQISRLTAAGAVDYLTKPLEVRRLLDVIDRALGLNDPAAEPRDVAQTVTEVR